MRQLKFVGVIENLKTTSPMKRPESLMTVGRMTKRFQGWNFQLQQVAPQPIPEIFYKSNTSDEICLNMMDMRHNKLYGVQRDNLCKVYFKTSKSKILQIHPLFNPWVKNSLKQYYECHNTINNNVCFIEINKIQFRQINYQT